MDKEAYERFRIDTRRAAGVLWNTLTHKGAAVTVVHHNDADGLCAAASLARGFGLIGIKYNLLAIEKIHELILRGIHAANPGCLIYADLGGQSCGLIARYSVRNPLVVILDHHLPGGETPGNLIHLNPEPFGISGDTEISGAGVAALFVAELVLWSAGTAPPLQPGARRPGLPADGDEAVSTECRERDPADDLPALFGIIGAVGDNQFNRGSPRGVNERFLAEALRLGMLRETAAGWTCRGFGGRTLEEIVELLNLLGSIGFSSGQARKGVDFLLGINQAEAVQTATGLAELKTRLFAAEMKRLAEEGLNESPHVRWVDVKERFLPMGVKAIGLFLEQLVAGNLAESARYVVGFQHFPDSIPGIGILDASLTKVSARVPPKLRAEIERGKSPDLMALIPEATGMLGGIADGCHRFSAACLIERGKEREFVEAIEAVLELHENPPDPEEPVGTAHS